MSIEIRELSLDSDSEKSFEITSFIRENVVFAVFLVLGVLFLIGGVVWWIHSSSTESSVEIIEESDHVVMVEIAGAINKPGVYEMTGDSRVNDLLERAGGLMNTADTSWISKTLNKAAVVEDGEKIYIPFVDEGNHSTSSTANELGGDQTISSDISGFSSGEERMVNINTSSAIELESLWGIGRITAQKVIEQRPYSKVEELLEKGILKKNVYDRNKNMMSVY